MLQRSRARRDASNAARRACFAELQKTCPFPMEANDASLPGNLSLFPDEFLIKVARSWHRWRSSDRLILTTHRLIHTHGRLVKDQTVVYLSDIRDVQFHKPFLHAGRIVVETAGGHSLTGLPKVKRGRTVRDHPFTPFGALCERIKAGTTV